MASQSPGQILGDALGTNLPEWALHPAVKLPTRGKSRIRRSEARISVGISSVRCVRIISVCPLKVLLADGGSLNPDRSDTTRTPLTAEPFTEPMALQDMVVLLSESITTATGAQISEQRRCCDRGHYVLSTVRRSKILVNEVC
jgi:hypothetical protein